MSDAGIPKPPAGVTTGAQPLPNRPDGQSGRVQNATGQLAQVIRPLTIEGVVAQHNADGSVRIQTAQGNLDVQLRGQTTPADGQQVQVDVSAGRPPRQAVVRPADEQTPQPQNVSSTTSAPAPAQNSGASSDQQGQQTASDNAQGASTSSRAAPAPLLTGDVTTNLTQQVQQPTAPPPPPQGTLTPGDDVRLLPLPPDQGATTTAASPAATASATPPQTQTGLPNLAGAAPAPLTPTQTATPAPALPPLPTAVLAPSPLLPAGSQTPPAPAQITNLALAATTVPAAVNGALHAPAVEPAAKPAASVIPAGAGRPPELLDVRITAVTPAGAALTAPDAKIRTAPAAPNPFFSAMTKTTAAPVTVPPQSAGSIIATVTGVTPGGLPVLSFTPPGQAYPSRFALQFNAANLQPGATVSFIPHADQLSPTTPALNNPSSPTPTYELLSGFQWPALDTIKTTLAQADPQAAQTLLHVLPAPAAPEQMPAAVMFFVAAVRSGDMAGWLGEKTIDALRRAGRGDAIDKLGRDMDGIDKLDSAPAMADDWRALPLPLTYGGEVQKMLLYYRQDRNAKADGEEGGRSRGTRFLFDMNLTRMGAVQLDGLHRPGAREDGKLDLIVRTRTPLSPPMQMAMRRAYISALEQSGHSGEMSFQNRPEQWVRVERR